MPNYRADHADVPVMALRMIDGMNEGRSGGLHGQKLGAWRQHHRATVGENIAKVQVQPPARGSLARMHRP